jgi:aspartate racemase
MKKIGLIGGTAPESTLEYYKELNRILSGKTEKKEYPEITIESINLTKALNYCKNQDYDLLEEYLLNAINNLAKCGVEIAALTAGTMHIVYDQLKEKSPLPLISIPETVCQEAANKGYRKVGLLGTIFTMEKDYMKKPFVSKGIEVITPNKDERTLINDIITNELEAGIVKDSSREKLVQIINKMKLDGIDAIILGCTELPMILNQEICQIACLDIVQLHIDRLVDLAMM